MTTDFDAIVRRYCDLPQNAGETLTDVHAFLNLVPQGEGRSSRSNFAGHFTASGLFVDAVKRRILLFHHPVHNAILQPGGHFENNNESPLDVAMRKVLQETIYKKEDLRYLPCDYDTLVPIDIDTHVIDNQKEPKHLHHDLRYVFLAVAGEGENREFRAKPAAATTAVEYIFRWYDLGELPQFQTFARLRKKLNDFLSIESARRRFFIGITREFPLDAHEGKSTRTIIVTHVLPDAVEFLEAVGRQTNLIAIIPKPKSKDITTCKRLKDSGFPILDVEREQIVPAVLDALTKSGNDRTVLMDIGGWFVPLLKELPGGVHKTILGIVEDTKNGERKYLEYARNNALPFRVVSVAESELKANEDHLVGKSIVFSADAILRACGLVLDQLECGVIGYGKIGRSIAQHLMQRGIKPCVVEIDSLRSVTAFREGCTVRHRDWANRNVDVIFCATGSKATGIKDFRSLRSGTFIFSVTSSDDEFDWDMLPNEYRIKKHATWANITVCDGEQNHFYLVNDGNAVNFLHDAVLWEFIQLVKGGIYRAMTNLIEGKQMEPLFANPDGIGPGAKQMFELDDEDQMRIARLWLETVLLGVRLEE
jgi:adenosylhomocysteinase